MDETRYVLCIVLFCGLYYGNVWNAKNFPFLSQQLFSSNSTSTHFDIYKQDHILNDKFELDESALADEGLPSFAASHASHLLTNNLSITASIVHGQSVLGKSRRSGLLATRFLSSRVEECLVC